MDSGFTLPPVECLYTMDGILDVMPCLPENEQKADSSISRKGEVSDRHVVRASSDSMTSPSPKNEKKSKVMREKWQDSEYRKKMIKSHKGKHYSSKTEFKKGMIPWNKNTKGIMPKPPNKIDLDITPYELYYLHIV